MSDFKLTDRIILVPSSIQYEQLMEAKYAIMKIATDPSRGNLRKKCVHIKHVDRESFQRGCVVSIASDMKTFELRCANCQDAATYLDDMISYYWGEKSDAFVLPGKSFYPPLPSLPPPVQIVQPIQPTQTQSKAAAGLSTPIPIKKTEKKQVETITIRNTRTKIHKVLRKYACMKSGTEYKIDTWDDFKWEGSCHCKSAPSSKKFYAVSDHDHNDSSLKKFWILCPGCIDSKEGKDLRERIIMNPKDRHFGILWSCIMSEKSFNMIVTVLQDTKDVYERQQIAKDINYRSDRIDISNVNPPPRIFTIPRNVLEPEEEINSYKEPKENVVKVSLKKQKVERSEREESPERSEHSDSESEKDDFMKIPAPKYDD